MESMTVVTPEGKMAAMQFFTNRKDAVKFALKFTETKSKKSDRDGSELGWKRLKREGWQICRVKHVLVK